MPARRLPPLNALRAFEAAARLGSFAAAGAELSVTASAISHQIAELEAAVGVKLFRRVGRGVQLTDAARAALPALSEGFDRLADGVARARQGQTSRLLNLTTSPGLAAKWLMPRIERFRDAHPDIDLRIDASMRLVDLAREDIHLAIRYGRGDYPGMRCELLMRSEVFPVCAPSLTRGAKALRRPTDLAHHALLHDESTSSDPSFPDWEMWLRASGTRGIDTTRGLRFNSVALAVDAAVNGRGVLLARSIFVADDLAAGRLVRPFGVAAPLDFSVHLVTSPQRRDEQRVRLLCDWLRREAAQAMRATPPASASRRKGAREAR